VPAGTLVVVAQPGLVPRSRLVFTAKDTSSLLTDVTIVVQRTSDQAYWNAATGAWQPTLYGNATTDAGGDEWTFQPEGYSRRAFVDTAVLVQAQALTAGGQPVTSEGVAMTIR
jgi:hypothetical protein